MLCSSIPYDIVYAFLLANAKNALTYDTIHCTLSGLKSLKRTALFFLLTMQSPSSSGL